ncbi:MAG: Cellulose-binding domain protein, partial [Myxococcaceae bacterium]|nr:Cellulose-binding domain protein [Myxococcaceae bacterium]
EGAPQASGAGQSVTADGTAQQGGGSNTTGSTDAPSGIGTKVFALCSGGAEVGSPRLLRLMTRREYQNTVRDLLFNDEPDVSTMPVEPRVRGYDNNAGASVVTSLHIDDFLSVGAAVVSKAVSQHKGQLVTCQPSEASCPHTFVQSFGLRAFRRPLSGDEQARYEAFFAHDLTQGDFDQGLTLALGAMLVSPNFLYRSEVGEAQADGTFKLTPYEVASALSYLYWGTMPDQTLFDAAARGALGSAAELEAQARRMLADPRATGQLDTFGQQWLGSDGTLTAFKDAAIYPSFSDSLRTAMMEEQRRFFNDIALVRDGKFSELYKASYVFANDELARFYGLTPAGSGFAKVNVTPASQRGGVLGLGSVLAALAHSNESSPIKRGKFVRDRLLCQDLPPPPANLDTTPPGLDPTLTTRARFAKHTSSPACSGCHQYIDGVGFGFEGFDGIGALRAVENGLQVDLRGDIRGREDLTADTDEEFNGTVELSSLLAESPTAQSCLTLQYYRYARGYEETHQDACSLDKLQRGFESQDLTIKELLIRLALLDSFTTRRAQQGKK